MTPTALSAELSDNISLMLAVSLTTMSVSSSGLSFLPVLTQVRRNEDIVATAKEIA